MNEPIIRVGILTAPKISVTFHGMFTERNSGERITGEHVVDSVGPEGQLSFEPEEPQSAWFELHDVTIGVDFHWQRRESQRFAGSLRIIPGLTAINLIPAEEYLKSVVSSEMNSHASEALLKAHAVISRSWLLAMLERKNADSLCSAGPDDRTDTCHERIQWWDREDHELFDVCADDHCQRYQGLGRMSPRAVVAVESTRGLVLTHGGSICDARFSKCCGGAFEQFENCWAPVTKPYLTAGRDLVPSPRLPDLTDEAEATRWIMGSPEAFCNTADTEVLDQVLNSYDRETPDFYRWTVEYDDATLADLIRRRTGIDFGSITALEPLARGTSGRIYRLRITGTKHTMIIGKELAIRRALSESHLYSSAFVVDRQAPGRWRLHGAGWGHGVGLCQIGAAMMGSRGYDYKTILLHYYHGATVTPLYR